jgi:RTA1 like protein
MTAFGMDENSFIMQLFCLTLGPAFFSAAVYIGLACIMVVYSAENLRLVPQ